MPPIPVPISGPHTAAPSPVLPPPDGQGPGAEEKVWLRLPLMVVAVGVAAAILLTAIVQTTLLTDARDRHHITVHTAVTDLLNRIAAADAAADAAAALLVGGADGSTLPRFAGTLLERHPHLGAFAWRLADGSTGVLPERQGPLPDLRAGDGVRLSGDTLVFERTVPADGGPASVAALVTARELSDHPLPGSLAFRATLLAPGTVAPPAGPNSLMLELPDQGWILRLEAPPVPPVSPAIPLATLCFALAVTVALAAYAQMVQRRSRAHARMSATLRRANLELEARIQERDRVSAILTESERKYRDLYQNALEGIFITSLEGRFLSVNPAMVRMLGYGSETELLVGLLDIGSQLYVDPARRGEMLRQMREKGTVQDFEAEMRRRDGSTVWLSLTARALRNSAGQITSFQGSCEDVTERRRAVEIMRVAMQQSEMANRAKGEFLANMSHELRTPLNAIIGFSEIIAAQSLGPIGNPAYAEYASDIHDSGRVLLDVINEILDLSAIETGRRELKERTVDIGRVVRGSLRLIRERALQGGVTLETALDETLPLVRADETALKQILSNLLSNAVKFTPPGGRITAGARETEDGRMLLTVRDTGIGMRPEDLAHAMEPFRQVEKPLTRHAGGAGLGLPLVKALVDLHGGSFELESTPDAGTLASVWLPADRVRRDTPPEASRTGGGKAGTATVCAARFPF
ncbi:non-motile and phage-resistance protein [Rhodospirillum centenum SW]|uniref:histidine kinase n=2 Tax=Rhodospirillum centenum TaxID=34018 RepID=B6IUB7_RHOCS|nr:non-motile and phage-resistance protein [Rhodospirillum centenum SW]